MSTIVVDYRELGSAKSSAENVAKRLNSYAESLQSKIANKLSSYSGSVTTNISSAKSNVNSKITQLNLDKTNYTNYATELDDIKEECKATDEHVESRVKSLTGTFRIQHNIPDTVGCLDRFFNGIANATRVTRWIDDGIDAAKDYVGGVKDNIKKWLDYDGGWEILKGSITAILGIAASIAALILSFPVSGILSVIALCGAVLGLVSSAVNLYHEFDANGMEADDPARAKRSRTIDSVQDQLRRTTDKALHILASGLDIFEFVAAISSIAKTAMKFKAEKINWFKSNAGQAIKDLKIDFKDFTVGELFDSLKDIGKGYLKDLWDATKNAYQIKGINSFKDNMSAVKNILSTAKNLFGGEFGDIIKGTLMSGVLIAELDIKDITTGKISTDDVNLDDIWSKLEKLFKTGDGMINNGKPVYIK